MALDGSLAQEQCRRYVGVAPTVSDESQYVQLTRAESHGGLCWTGLPAWQRGEEVARGGDELQPCGFVLEEDVIAPVERHELSSGDERRQRSALLERCDGVVARMEDQG